MEPSAVPSSVDPFARLALMFGPRLEVERGEDRVCWTFDGRSAVATVGRDGVVEASFFDRAAVDLASDVPVAAVYERPRVRYGLDLSGCARMVDDIVAFFGGLREPRFHFVKVAELRRP